MIWQIGSPSTAKQVFSQAPSPSIRSPGPATRIGAVHAVRGPIRHAGNIAARCRFTASRNGFQPLRNSTADALKANTCTMSRE